MPKKLQEMISFEAVKAERNFVIRSNRARMSTIHVIVLGRQGKGHVRKFETLDKMMARAKSKVI